MNRIGIIAVALCAFASTAIAQTKTGTTTTPPAKTGTTPPTTTPAGTKPAEPAKGAPAKDTKAAPPATTAAPTGTDTKAAPPQPMTPPAPAPELEQIKWMAKNWTCTGKMWDPMSGEESAMGKGTIKSKWILGKNWIQWDYSVAKTKTFPKWEAHGIIGIDTASKKAVFIGVDSMGGWMNLAGTPGDSVTFEGDAGMMGMKSRVRMTYTKTDKTITSTMEMQMGKEWKKTMEETCK